MNTSVPTMRVVEVYRVRCSNVLRRPTRTWAYYVVVGWGDETFRASIKGSVFHALVRNGAKQTTDRLKRGR